MSAQAFHSKDHSRKSTQMGSNEEQQLLHVTYHLDIIYMYTKYNQNISKGKRIIEDISFPLLKVIQWRQLNGQRGGATILECDILS